MKDGEKFVAMLCVILLIITTLLTWVLMDADRRGRSRLDGLEYQVNILTESQGTLFDIVASTPEAHEAEPEPPAPSPTTCPGVVVRLPMGITEGEFIWCARYVPMNLGSCLDQMAESER